MIGTAVGLGLVVAAVQGAVAQQNPVTAIDIALEPDATMIQRATAAQAAMQEGSRGAKLSPLKLKVDQTASHSRAVLSLPPLASSSPDASKATVSTWPS